AGGAAVAWPLAARAQQAERMRRMGLLMGTADDREGQARVLALKQGLQELGWTDGRNIQIETRFGGADADRIRSHAAELVALARRHRRQAGAFSYLTQRPARPARKACALEMLEYAGLSSRHADRQRLAVCHAKLDDIGAVGLRTVDHNAVLAARWS